MIKWKKVKRKIWNGVSYVLYAPIVLPILLYYKIKGVR
jgi:hypothetical protein